MNQKMCVLYSNNRLGLGWKNNNVIFPFLNNASRKSVSLIGIIIIPAEKVRVFQNVSRS